VRTRNKIAWKVTNSGPNSKAKIISRCDERRRNRTDSEIGIHLAHI